MACADRPRQVAAGSRAGAGEPAQVPGRFAAAPDQRKAATLGKEDKGEYVYDQFEFFNGVDQTVTGVLLIPKVLGEMERQI
jgi:hypothetical protein